ncbi:MAG: translation initiation factor IF-2 [Actinomycetota bacterium]
MRVHELAKELGVTSKDIIGALEEMGLGGRTASSSVPEEAVPRLRASGGKAIPGAKPRRATEEPVPKRKPKPKPKPKVVAKPEPAKPVLEAVPDLEQSAEPEQPASPVSVAETLPVLRIPHGATAQDLADRTSRTAAEVVKLLLDLGEMVTASQSLSDEALSMVAAELGYEVDYVGVGDESQPEEEEEVDESRLRPRPPVVTVMGHVDHGKTLLLDSIRKTDVAAGEFGGITQHIGAYQVHANGREITFIDTPGHEAFTAMRARGAKVTDIAVLVVAADDGVMPQTVEALDHAKAAGVSVVVAVNKVDKEEADPQRVRQQLVERELVPVEWGGNVEFVDVSAKTGQGLDKLLETLLLESELKDLKADPDGPSRGVVVEAHLDKGRGPVATLLVQRGTLEAGDALVCGTHWAKVRALHDENGNPVAVAGPGKPVQTLGWSAVPNAGEEFREVKDEREARHLAQEREAKSRAADLVSDRPAGLADLIALTREAEITDLNVILKGDTQGSVEALADALKKLPQDEVRVRVVHRGVGAINESDVTLAKASQAVVVGFNVRPEPKARDLADEEGVDLRLHRVIYEAIDEVRKAVSGMLTPGEEEAELARVEVRATFRVPRVGVAAGSYVTKGTVQRNARARVVRDGAVVYDGKIATLRRFKDDVKEVAEGFECGIGLENFQDVKEGDVIEVYEVREVPRSL